MGKQQQNYTYERVNKYLNIFANLSRSAGTKKEGQVSWNPLLVLQLCSFAQIKFQMQKNCIVD